MSKNRLNKLRELLPDFVIKKIEGSAFYDCRYVRDNGKTMHIPFAWPDYVTPEELANEFKELRKGYA